MINQHLPGNIVDNQNVSSTTQVNQQAINNYINDISSAQTAAADSGVATTIVRNTPTVDIVRSGGFTTLGFLNIQQEQGQGAQNNSIYSNGYKITPLGVNTFLLKNHASFAGVTITDCINAYNNAAALNLVPPIVPNSSILKIDA